MPATRARLAIRVLHTRAARSKLPTGDPVSCSAPLYRGCLLETLLAQKRQNLIVLRKTPDLVLREDASAVDFDVEDAVLALDEPGFDTELAANCGRQTGGLGQVVSRYAVGDGDPHRKLLWAAMGKPHPMTRLLAPAESKAISFSLAGSLAHLAEDHPAGAGKRRGPPHEPRGVRTLVVVAQRRGKPSSVSFRTTSSPCVEVLTCLSTWRITPFESM